MKTTSNRSGVATPTVNISVAKNRLKIYNKDAQIPTIYLEKDTEFEIELFNPTTDVIVAEIVLNDKAISQGGLVLRQGERIFLERYLDVAKKFRFETYEVSNTSEVQAAIKDNGSLKVKFYREDTSSKYDLPTITTTIPWNSGGYVYGSTTDSFGYVHNDMNMTLNLNSSLDDNATIGNSQEVGALYSNATIQPLSVEEFMTKHPELNLNGDDLKAASLSTDTRGLKKKSKKTETGRVTEGSASGQKFIGSDRKFFSWPFVTVEYKLLPISTKKVTGAEIGKRRYCTNCGTKAKATFKFCPTCGSKV